MERPAKAFFSNLRTVQRATRDRLWTRALCWPSCAPFMLSYLGILVMVNLLGVKALEPLVYQTWRPNDFSFYWFWFETAPLGVSTLTALMSSNTLVIVYLWSCFRTEGRRDFGKRLFIYSSAVVLMMLQLLYWKVGTLDPPAMYVLKFPS